ncbi:hypothetical protein FHG87_022598 [Trinorchestia longiramus]|nr:hypothetical protein FHG87_022598 [Trinorchestia longiramus]
MNSISEHLSAWLMHMFLSMQERNYTPRAKLVFLYADKIEIAMTSALAKPPHTKKKCRKPFKTLEIMVQPKSFQAQRKQNTLHHFSFQENIKKATEFNSNVRE